ncbi:MAG TPA: D-aminoacyl-tRNA deacylase [Thermodesulfobacteriota bacterium]|nr:D-aminoacyl-tRNA deacylase [Thermodesulfobacteriota bacterium]
MRAVTQRVKSAQVIVNEKIIGSIGFGLLVLLGISREDNCDDADYLVEKTINLRIFDDQDGKMNRSLLDVGGEMLIVSQFTLIADCRKGRRPSFTAAAEPAEAKNLYQYFIERLKEKGITVATGEFQAFMEVGLINNGPVTILMDSKKVF